MNVLVAVATIAVAQDGPVMVTPQRDWEWLQLDDISAALEFEWRHDNDEVEPRGGPRRRVTEDRLREILELRTSGFVGNPNLLELDLGGRFWLEQRWFDAETDERSDQELLDWDVSGLFLKESRFPFTIYSRQNTSDVDRVFGGTLENRFRETGARVDYRSSVIPTNVQVFRRKIEQRDTSVGEDFTIDQDTILADGRIEMGQAHRLAWDVKFDDVDESGDLRTPISFDRLEANATHTVEFGDRQQHFLRTRMRFFEETGDRALRQVRIDPRLRFRHTDRFTTWYDYSFARDDRPQQEQRSHRATANLQHRLFDSLTTIASGGVDYFDVPSEDFDSDERFARLDVEYLKQVPLGRMQAAVGGFVSRVDDSERGSPIAVSGSLFTFNAANLIVIDQRNVDEDSIFITDTTGTIVYGLGSDYTVLGFPDRVEIRRVAGGNIAPGQSVLVDFVIGPEPGGVTDTAGIGFDVRYTFEDTVLEGLSLYFQYFRQDESREILVDEFPENDFEDYRYGVEYLLGKLSLKAEYQERDSTLSPFDAIRLEGRYTEPLGRGSNIVLSALYQELDREFENLKTTTTTFSGQWHQRFDDRLRLSLILQYQMQEDSLDFDSDAFEQQLDVTWRRGQTEVYAQIRNSITDTNEDDTTLQRFIVGIRREF